MVSVRFVPRPLTYEWRTLMLGGHVRAGAARLRFLSGTTHHQRSRRLVVIGRAIRQRQYDAAEPIGCVRCCLGSIGRVPKTYRRPPPFARRERGTNVGPKPPKHRVKRGSRADQRAKRVNKLANPALSAKPPSPVQIRAAAVAQRELVTARASMSTF
jgi:hypothetical protein